MSGPAPIHPEPSYDGRSLRFRCSMCSKIAFTDRQAADEAAEKIFNDRGVRMYSYEGKRGRDRCGWWHLSRASPG